jgi:hypothetical protein
MRDRISRNLYYMNDYVFFSNLVTFFYGILFLLKNYAYWRLLECLCYYFRDKASVRLIIELRLYGDISATYKHTTHSLSPKG